MTQDSPNQRPDCKAILEEKHLWALNVNELDVKLQLTIFVESKEDDENSFINSILETKLLEIEVKRIKETSMSERETEILKSLKCYKHRSRFVRNYLVLLHDCLKNCCDTRNDLIELIIDLMSKYQENNGIQLAATGCLVCLVTDKIMGKTDLKLPEKVVESTLNAMQNFPNHQKLQSNVLLILNSYCLLQCVKFDRLKCIQLVLNSLVSFRDTDMNCDALEICSMISDMISKTDKLNLCSKHVYIKTLLAIVESCLQFCKNFEILLEFCLVILSNLSKSSLEICKLLLKNGLANLFHPILNVI
jgi:hypothetical protein